MAATVTLDEITHGGDGVITFTGTVTNVGAPGQAPLIGEDLIRHLVNRSWEIATEAATPGQPRPHAGGYGDYISIRMHGLQEGGGDTGIGLVPFDPNAIATRLAEIVERADQSGAHIDARFFYFTVVYLVSAPQDRELREALAAGGRANVLRAAGEYLRAGRGVVGFPQPQQQHAPDIDHGDDYDGGGPDVDLPPPQQRRVRGRRGQYVREAAPRAEGMRLRSGTVIGQALDQIRGAQQVGMQLRSGRRVGAPPPPLNLVPERRQRQRVIQAPGMRLRSGAVLQGPPPKRGRYGAGAWKRPANLDILLNKPAMIRVPESGIGSMCLIAALWLSHIHIQNSAGEVEMAARHNWMLIGGDDRIVWEMVQDCCRGWLLANGFTAEGPHDESAVCKKISEELDVTVTVLDWNFGAQPHVRYQTSSSCNRFMYILRVGDADGIGHYHGVRHVHRLYGALQPQNYCHWCTDHGVKIKPKHFRDCYGNSCTISGGSCSNGVYLTRTAFKKPKKRTFRMKKIGKELQFMYKCRNCGKTDLRREDLEADRCLDTSAHMIAEVPMTVCSVCRETMAINEQESHQCVIPKPKKLKIGESRKYYVYDVESMVTASKVHVVNLVVMMGFGLEMQADDTDPETWVFRTIDEFCRFIFNNDRFDGCTFIAHNGGKYDHHFVLRWCETRYSNVKKMTANGSLSNLLEMTCEGRRFIDSYKHIPIALANFAKTYGIHEGEKGHFPHTFNRAENQHYRGPMPDIEYYGVDRVRGTTMDETNRKKEELMQWWEEERQKYVPFTDEYWDLQKELLKYCKQDVYVLRKGAIRHRDIFMHLSDVVYSDGDWTPNNVDPFQYKTLPECLKNLWLAGVPNDVKIASIPYRRRADWCPIAVKAALDDECKDLYMLDVDYSMKTYSLWSSVYEYRDSSLDLTFDLVGYSRRITTLHGQQRIAFKVLSCDYWGCPCCYPNDGTKSSVHGQLHSVQYESISGKMQAANRSGWNYVFAWECKVKERLEGRASNVNDELCNLMVDREMFYGGRTEVFTALADNSVDGLYRFMRSHVDDGSIRREDISIEMGDVTSLYPYILATKELPIGHPEIKVYPSFLGTEHMDILQEIRERRFVGIVRCRVKPNRDDEIGLLPRREVNGRLTFPVEEMDGCWTHTELYHALDNGYKVVRVWETHRFNGKMSNRMFRGYVEYFLRIKIEAEGWPRQDMTEEEKDAYCEEWFVNNGNMARPNKDNVDKNPGLRYIAKLCLNSLWGKLCQRDPNTQVGYFNNSEQLYDILHNPVVIDGSVTARHVKGNQFEYKCELNDDGIKRSSAYNIYIATYITAHARTILHLGIQQVTQRGGLVLYCDTDSIAYVSVRGKGLIYDNGLGHWSSEIPSGTRGLRFVSTAPKSYCLECENGYTKVKTKGITIDSSNVHSINFETFKKLVIEEIMVLPSEERMEVRASQFQIRLNTRKEGEYNLVSINDMQKKIRPVYTKRLLLPCAFHPDDFPSEALGDTVRFEEIGLVPTYPYGNSKLDNFRQSEKVYSDQIIYDVSIDDFCFDYEEQPSDF